MSCSYEAGEDNEISFKEGERIIQIEAASDDWWQGTDKHGNVGLFPGECSAHLHGGDSRSCLNCPSVANYVELQG